MSTHRSKVVEECLGHVVTKLDGRLAAFLLRPCQSWKRSDGLLEQPTWFITKLTAIFAPLGHLGSGGFWP
jgi:hypothetical protein